jgi:MFS family permease
MPPTARRLTRLTVAWALLADTIPLYPLYALFFVHAGLSVGEITGLFALWSIVGIVAEVPTGALADRYSRRGALAMAGVLQAVGYAIWILSPSLVSFAAGFVLWGVGGALVSGALEALLYDGLLAVGADSRFPAVLGRVTAAGLIAQLPAAAGATLLFSVGGYTLAGWVSIGFCLGAAALAIRIPEPARNAANDDKEEEEEEDDDGERFFATLRAGLIEAASHPAVRRAVLAVALLSGLDAMDEYFPLIAHGWGIATAVVPLAVLSIPLIGAACAAAAGSVPRLRPWAMSLALGMSALIVVAAGVWRHPPGLAAVALFYGVYRLVLVVVNTWLQRAIEGPSRATVTSVAAFGTELATFALYAAWVLGGVVLVAMLTLSVALILPRLAPSRAH